MEAFEIPTAMDENTAAEGTEGYELSLKDPTETGCPLWLEKLGNGPFPEFGRKSWKAIGFSPALTGTAGMFYLSLVRISVTIR